QLVATTGRLSSQDPNLMNIPIRTELGRRIRAAFIPAAGWRFVAADYSQIELRILAHLSGDPGIIEAFRQGEDIHTRTASEVFRLPPAEVTPLQRTIAKSANFAILYGVSAFGLSQATKIDQKAAQRYIDDYFAAHPRVRAFIDATLAFGREHGFVTTLLGRRRGARAGNHGIGAAAPDPPRRRREVGRGLGGGMTRRFLLVGLTGGIATGKSTVAEVFRRLGSVIIDADVLAREVVVPGEPA